ncbi:hypothetical protein SISSUDRAFT_1133188 [Sistotremastrum suecicum HHB10207 ss-3]|uniref:Uncharacterized protein n=1 Tax=Sistotremastrum suecicum HHB10207 ss-3 TaxID=1314776 RepID=A0A165XP99_9AGAM|nr:hypothetical protein SISSUDRAFT_1133188 [Sistotremastrum suecicum HHB10207 ss-3]
MKSLAIRPVLLLLTLSIVFASPLPTGSNYTSESDFDAGEILVEELIIASEGTSPPSSVNGTYNATDLAAAFSSGANDLNVLSEIKCGSRALISDNNDADCSSGHSN